MHIAEAFVEIFTAKLEFALPELNLHITPELRAKLIETAGELFVKDFCVDEEPPTSDEIGHARWRDEVNRVNRNRKKAEEWVDVVVESFLSVIIRTPKVPEGPFTYDIPIDENTTRGLASFYIVNKNPDFFRVMKKALLRKEDKNAKPLDYLRGTPLMQLFPIRQSFGIPRRVFSEHGAIFAPSGHGKTQLLQALIGSFLNEPDPPGMFILDSQGSMLKKIERLEVFTTRLRERLVVLDPPEPALNFFQFDGSDMEVLELAQYLFTALDRGLTAKQGTAIPYLLKLIQQLPGATLDTLREIMDDKSKFEASPYFDAIMRLDKRSQDFFRHQFYGSELKVTKQQVSNRLYTILGNESFVRMFAAKENRFSAFEAMQEKKIVLVNTSQKVLGETASSIFGRYIIAQVLAAAYQRDPDADNHLTLLVLDEAFEYFDEKTERILSQARKYGLGLLFATQWLEQMTPGVKAAVNATTAIKMAGPVSYNDAMMLAREMYTTGDFIRSMHAVDRQYTEFACHVRNLTPGALKLTIPYGTLEQQPQRSEASLKAFRAENRARYGAQQEPPAPTASPAASGIAQTPHADHIPEIPTNNPPSSDIELVIYAARRLETLLETHYGASGRGLHEKLTSIETKLPPDVLNCGRYVATIRNKVIHLHDFSLPDREYFLRCAQIFEDHFSVARGAPPQTPEIPNDPDRRW